MTDLLAALRPASFRGVSFMVVQDDKTFGRRIETHEFPGRDDPYHEDLGRAPDAFTIEAVCGGLNYKADADALEAALVKGGPGQLIHPHYGLVSVVAVEGRRSHNTAATGEARFSITFRRYTAPSFPTAGADTAFNVMSRATSLMDTVSLGFSGLYQAAGLPDYVETAARGVLGNLEGTFNEALNRFGLGWLSSVLDMPANAYSVTGIVDAIKGAFGALRDAGTVPVRPQLSGLSAAQGVVSKRANPSVIADALLDLAQDIPTLALSPARRLVNADQLNTLMRASALSGAAAATAQAEIISREDALVRRQNLVSALNGLRDDMAALDMGDAWSAATDLKTAVVRDINERLGRLPVTVRIKTPQSLPSVNLAHRLYGEANLFQTAADLATRNKVRHPGFMPSQGLEVLVNA